MRPKESDMYKRIKILGQRSLEKQIYLNIQKAILFVYEQEKIVFRIERKFRKLVKSLEQWLNQKMYKTVKGELYLVMNNQGLDQIIEEGTKIMNQGVLSFPKIFIKNQQKYTRFIQLDQNQKKNKDKNQKKQLKNQFIKFMIKQNCRNNSLKNQEKEKHLKKQKNLFIISNIIRSIIIIRRNCGNCRIKIFRQKNCSERFIKFKEQQQIQQKVETAAFDFQPQLQFQVFDVTQKKPIKQNKPSNSQRDEEKKLKKIIKQYIRIPFIKKPQIIQKRNSENDMQEMINEFKIVLQEQSKNVEKLPYQDQNDSEDSKIYLEDSSEDFGENSDTLSLKTQINTWMYKPWLINQSGLKILKDKLIIKLGYHFEQLYKLAKLCTHQKDLGIQDIKRAIMDNIDLDENKAETCATLLVTLATIGY